MENDVKPSNHRTTVQCVPLESIFEEVQTNDGHVTWWTMLRQMDTEGSACEPLGALADNSQWSGPVGFPCMSLLGDLAADPVGHSMTERCREKYVSILASPVLLSTLKQCFCPYLVPSAEELLTGTKHRFRFPICPGAAGAAAVYIQSTPACQYPKATVSCTSVEASFIVTTPTLQHLSHGRHNSDRCATSDEAYREGDTALPQRAS